MGAHFHTCECMHNYKSVCGCVCILVCACACTHMCMYAYVCVCVCVCMCVCTEVVIDGIVNYAASHHIKRHCEECH